MNNKDKERLEYLKEKNEIFVKKQNLKKNSLFQECLKALQDSIIIEDKNDEEKIQDTMYEKFPIDKYRHIISTEITYEDLMFSSEKNYFIIWDNLDVAILMCKGKRIKGNLDDIFAVAFDTYIIAENYSEIIHNDDLGKMWRIKCDE